MNDSTNLRLVNFFDIKGNLDLIESQQAKAREFFVSLYKEHKFVLEAFDFEKIFLCTSSSNLENSPHQIVEFQLATGTHLNHLL